MTVSTNLSTMMTDNESHSRVLSRPLMRFLKAPEWGLVAGILFVLAVIYFLDHDHAFFREVNIRPLLHRVALFGVLAVGAAVVIIAGGIDLSTGAVVAISSVVSAKLLTEWLRTAGSQRAGSVDSDRGGGDRSHVAHGSDDRLAPRSHDQRAADSAVHRDAGDDGRPA